MRSLQQLLPAYPRRIDYSSTQLWRFPTGFLVPFGVAGDHTRVPRAPLRQPFNLPVWSKANKAAQKPRQHLLKCVGRRWPL